MLQKKYVRRRGYTLTELAFSMVLMGFVLALGVSVTILVSRASVGVEMQTTIVREDSRFAAALNEAIQKSTTAFTIPEKSFTEEKLTAGWCYLGLMENVHIPAAFSRTGEEMTADQALVYIEYIGTEAPSSVPSDCNLLSNTDGFFYQKILGHSFTDSLGTEHRFTLEFLPTDPTDTSAQSITYEFESVAVSNSGVGVDEWTSLDVDTMLTALNAIQIVYKGSPANPAVALAYRRDFMPSDSAEQGGGMPAATVVMVLDTSGSMDQRLGGKTRMEALKENVRSFAAELAKNHKLNMLIIPFASYAGSTGNGFNTTTGVTNGTPWSGPFVFNVSTGESSPPSRVNLNSRIDSLSSSGGTNVGDGLRRAYYELGNWERSCGDEGIGKVSLILMTDGEMNACSVDSYRSNWWGDGTVGNYYTGSNLRPPYIVYDGMHSRACEYAREYAEIWAQRIMTDYSAEAYLISLGNGMSRADKDMLESVFGTTTFDADSLTDFSEAFTSIAAGVEESLWAFEGPRL